MLTRVGTAILMLLVASPTLGDTGPNRPRGWWANLDLGAGNVRREYLSDSRTDATFFLGLGAGYTFNERIRVGLETNGFNLESGNFNDPAIGSGISQVVLATVYCYPIATRGLFLKAGTGWSSYWSRGGASRTTDRSAYVLGGGWETRLSRDWRASPFLERNWGSVDALDYAAWTLGVSLIYTPREN